MAHEAPNDMAKAPPTAHRRHDSIALARVILPIFAVLAALGFGVAEWLARGEARHSPGSLASVHSQWDRQCAACHETSAPLGATNWWALASDQSHVADVKCQSCHAGPPHHEWQKRSEVVGCTACHQEHKGSPGRLLAVADSHCLVCHADLEKHFVPQPIDDDEARKLLADLPVKPGDYLSVTFAGPRFANVTSFTIGGHPEFAIPKKDPGTIAFNHALHMIAGMGTDAAKAGPFTLEQLSPADRERYRKPGQADRDAVTLDCRSCHVSDAGDAAPVNGHGLPANALNPPRTSGDVMQPIVYERHCQACHPLTVGRVQPGDSKSEPLAVRHRQQPKEILDQLRGHYTNLHLKGLWKPASPDATGVLPGKPAAEAIDAEAAAAAETLLLDRHRKQIESTVLGQTTCQKCHPSLDPAKGAEQTIPPANIPAVWMPHARFDHSAHRAVDCRECHGQAFPGPGSSTTSGDVMLPGIATCVKCHAPAQGVGAAVSGGARHDCVVCHSYHHGDAPLHGRGSRARLPQSTRGIREFLIGK